MRPHREGGESRGYFPGAPKLVSKKKGAHEPFLFLPGLHLRAVSFSPAFHCIVETLPSPATPPSHSPSDFGSAYVTSRVQYATYTREMINWASLRKKHLLLHYFVMANSRICHCRLFKPNWITHKWLSPHQR